MRRGAIVWAVTEGHQVVEVVTKRELAEGVRRRVDFLKAVRGEMKLQELDIVGRNIVGCARRC